MHLFKQNNIWMAVLTDCHLYILTHKRNCLCSFHALQIYFHHVGASLRWQSVGATLSFIALYRGVFFKWMHADKTFRVTRTQYFNGKDWTCKVMIREKDIALFINNKINNHVNWEDLTKFEEAKTYYKLTSKDQIEGVMLDKDSFTEGDSSSFKQWMLEQHPEIKYGPIDPAFDK